MSLSANLLNLLMPLGKVFPLSGLIQITNCKLAIPMYHSVNDTIPTHLKYLNCVRSTSEFTKDLDTLLKTFRPVDIHELINIIDKDQVIDKPCFHLTFDNGLRSFNDTVAPILLQKGIPATCFLSSGFIGNKDLFYKHKISLIIDILHHEKAGSYLWDNYHKWTHQHNLSGEYYREQLHAVKFEQREIINELSGLLEINCTQYLKENKPYLDEKQIEDLISKGLTFGSHSINHPDYEFINKEDQLRETCKSLSIIESEFKLNYRVFSFPFNDCGISSSFFDAVYNENLIDLSFGCAGIRKDSFPKNLQRIPIEINNKSLKEILKKEYFKYFLLKILGKHKILRN
jgi:peptidoglycan/xylan/chitin deacetylase (PgdA/CDA1 family)